MITDSTQFAIENLQQTVDSLKLIVENSKMNAGQIEGFYNNAWTKLIYTITALMIVVPSAIAYFQRERWKGDKAELKFEIAVQVKKDLDQAELELKNYSKKLAKNSKRFTEARAFHLQAVQHMKEGKYSSALQELTNVTRNYIHLKEHENAYRCIANIETCLVNLDHNDWQNLNRKKLGLNKLLKKISLQSNISATEQIISNIKIRLTELKKSLIRPDDHIIINE